MGQIFENTPDQEPLQDSTFQAPAPLGQNPDLSGLGKFSLEQHAERLRNRKMDKVVSRLREAAQVEEGEALRLADLSAAGIPKGLADRNPDRVKQFLSVKDSPTVEDMKKVKASSETFFRKIAEDKAFAAIAWDDLPTASFGAQAKDILGDTFFTGPAKTIDLYRSGVLGTERMTSVLLTGEDLDQEKLDELRDLRIIMSERERDLATGPDGRERGYIGGILPRTGEMAPIIAGGLLSRGLGGAIGGLAGSVTFPGVGTVSGAVTGQYLGVVAHSFALETPNIFNELMDLTDESGQPLDPQIALGGAIASGVPIAMVEAGGFTVLANKLGGTLMAKREIIDGAKDMLRNQKSRGVIKKAITDLGTVVATESGTEGIQESIQIIVEELAKYMDPDAFEGQDFNLKSIVSDTDNQDRVLGAMKTASQAMLGTFGPVAGSSILSAGKAQQFTEEGERVMQAMRNRGSLDQMAEISRTSKIRERSEPKFREYIEDEFRGTDMENIRIPAVEVERVMNEDPEAAKLLQTAAPDITKQIEQARQNNGDVLIPAGPFFSRIAPETTVYDQLSPHVRLRAGDQTYAEAEVSQGKLERDIDKAIADEEQRQQFRQESEDIHNRIVDTLISEGAPGGQKAAEATAATWQAFFERMALLNNTSPRALFDEFFNVKGPGQVIREGRDKAVQRVISRERKRLQQLTPEALKDYATGLGVQTEFADTDSPTKVRARIIQNIIAARQAMVNGGTVPGALPESNRDTVTVPKPKQSTTSGQDSAANLSTSGIEAPIQEDQVESGNIEVQPAPPDPEAEILRRAEEIAAEEYMANNAPHTRVQPLAAKGFDPDNFTPTAGLIVPNMPTELIHANPAELQYKEENENDGGAVNPETGETGSTAHVTDISQFDRAQFGVIRVWQNPEDGVIYVVDGHNRLGMAKRLGVPDIPVMFLEADTFLAARAIGAILNISGGKGTPLDAATFFRDTGYGVEDLKARGVKVSDGMARRGLALAALHDTLFAAFKAKELSETRGMIIGEALPDQDLQIQLWAMLQKEEGKGRKITDAMVKELAAIIDAAPRENIQQETLFGTEEFMKSYVMEKAQLMAAVRRRMSQDKSLFATVVRNAEHLEEAGNTIAREESSAISKDAAITLAVYDTLKTSSGAIGDALNEGSRAIGEGENVAKVTARTYKRIQEAIPGLIGTAQVRANDAGATRQGGRPSGDIPEVRPGEQSGNLRADTEVAGRPAGSNSGEVQAPSRVIDAGQEELLQRANIPSDEDVQATISYLNRSVREGLHPTQQGFVDRVLSTANAAQRAAIEANVPNEALADEAFQAQEDLFQIQRDYNQAELFQGAASSAFRMPAPGIAPNATAPNPELFDNPYLFLGLPEVQAMAQRAVIDPEQSTHLIDTPERQAMRDQAVVDMLNQTHRDDPIELKTERKLTLIMGPPGSGKSFMANPIIEEQGALEIDADLAKAHPVFAEDFQGGRGAAKLHRESANIAKEALDQALASGVNIVHPVVGKTYPSLAKEIQKYRDAGYSVDVKLVYVNPKISLERVYRRYYATGRFISGDYPLLDVELNPIKNYLKLLDDGILNVQDWEVIDNGGPRDAEKRRLTPDDARAEIESVRQSLDAHRRGLLGGYSLRAPAEPEASPESDHRELEAERALKETEQLRHLILGDLPSSLDSPLSIETSLAALNIDVPGVDLSDSPVGLQNQTLFSGMFRLFQGAFHGTGAAELDSGKPSTQYVGNRDTGEGNQARGWGLYFSSVKNIALAYMRAHSKDKLTINGHEVYYGPAHTIPKSAFLSVTDQVLSMPRGTGDGLMIDYLVPESLRTIPGFINLEWKRGEFAADVARIIKDWLWEGSHGDRPNPAEWIAREVDRKIGETEVRIEFNEELLRDFLNGDSFPDDVRQKTIDDYQKLNVDYRQTLESWKRLADELRAGNVDIQREQAGSLFQVDIPDAGNMLSWDLPLSMQEASVQEAVIKLRADLGILSRYADPTGEQLYAALYNHFDEQIDTEWIPVSDGPTDKLASQELARRGIPGIRYLDGFSRDKGDGTENFVIFDDKFIGETIKLMQEGNEQKPRGSFMPDQFLINLFATADLSTALHESAHAFIHIMRELSGRNNAPQILHDDLDAIARYVGAADADDMFNNAERYAEFQERFADAFLKWLSEGEAPSRQLQSAFGRFRKWLLGLYRIMAVTPPTDAEGNELKINSEIKAVFSRMLASEETIEAASGAIHFEPLSREELGMSEREYEDYLQSVELAKDEAKQRLDAKIVRIANKKYTPEWKKRRKLVKSQVVRDLENSALWKAKAALMAPGQDLLGRKIRTQDVIDIFGKEQGARMLKKLPQGKHRIVADDGENADALAVEFGFDDGREMIVAISGSGSKAQAIEAETDKRMMELELQNPDFRETPEAKDALQNAHHMNALLAELDAFNRLTGRTKAPAKVYQKFADDTIARKEVKDIRPEEYLTAQNTAWANFSQALAAGDMESARTEKQRQITNMYLYRAARDARKKADRIIRHIERLAKRKGTRANIEPDYMEQIDAIIGRFDFRRSAPARPSKPLVEFIKEKTDEDLALRVDTDIIEFVHPEIRKRVEPGQERVSYKRLPMEVLEGIFDAISNLETLGRDHRYVYLAGQRILAEDAATRLINNAVANLRAQHRSAFTERTSARRKIFLTGLLANHRKAANLARSIDGFEDGGDAWDILTRPINEAQDAQGLLEAEAYQKLTELFSVYTSSELNHQVFPVEKSTHFAGRALRAARNKVFDVPDHSFKKNEILAIALNMGNADNYQRLLEVEPMRINVQTLPPILDHLTKADWDFVQGVWDYIDSWWPAVEELERRNTGVAPKKVEPREVHTKHGKYRGGYYPIMYNTSLTAKSTKDAIDEAAKRMMMGGTASAKTKQDHLKERIGSGGRRLRLDLMVMYDHLTDTIHDLTHRENIQGINKLLRMKFTSESGHTIDVQQVLQEHLGIEETQELNEWLKRVAAGDMPSRNKMDKIFTWLRRGTAITAMGWKVSTALVQPFGLTQSIQRVGAKWIGQGLAEMMDGFVNWGEFTQELYDRSPMMARRGQTLTRELRDVYRHLEKNRQLNQITSSYFGLITFAQQFVDIPTWLGQYNKSLADGETEERAAAIADQAVLDTQGSGEIKDLSSIESGNPALKLWTLFYTFFNTTLNLSLDAVTKARMARNPAEKAMLIRDAFLLYFLPATTSAYILGHGPDDDDNLAAWMVKENLSYMSGMSPVTRDIGSLVQGFEYNGPAGARGMGDILRGGKTVATTINELATEGETEITLRDLEALNQALGVTFGYPAGQINVTAEGLIEIMSGESKDPRDLAIRIQND